MIFLNLFSKFDFKFQSEKTVFVIFLMFFSSHFAHSEIQEIHQFNQSFISFKLKHNYTLNAKNQNEEDSLWTEDENYGIEYQDDEEFIKNKIKKNKNKSFSMIPHWGFGLGISPITLEVKNKTSIYTPKATNFVVKLSYDIPVKKYTSLLLGASLLPITASQADATLGYAKFEANYTSFEANGRLNFLGSNIQGPWIGGGGSYLLIGKGTSNIVSSSSIKSRFAYQINAGYNAAMGSEYLMLRADYYIHPQAQSSSGYVKISQMVFSANYFF